METPFLVIKQHTGDYVFKRFATIEEANAAVNPTNEFPGEYVCVYNLEAGRYVHIEHFPGGVDKMVSQIINEQK